MKTVDLLSPMTGTIGQIHIDEGGRVESGEVVLDVECMKSFFDVRAPATGIVRYKVALGELVNPDDVIAVIEVDEGENP